MKLRKQGHCAYRCEYHLLLVSKYRREIFNAGSYAYFQEIMKGVEEDMGEVEVLEMNHDVNHVHILLSIPPKFRVSDVVRHLKSVSGRMLRKKFSYMRQAYWVTDGIWSDGYFVSTVGVDESVIQKYIQKQGQEDKGQAELGLI